ncbi:MAG: hypothetical protein AAGI38_15580 [Bacteroidota bacterium]
MEANLYKAVLKHLSLIPEEYLSQVNGYLTQLRDRISEKEKNRQEILSLAGGWAEMKDAEFEEFLEVSKKSGNDLLGREIEL